MKQGESIFPYFCKTCNSFQLCICQLFRHGLDWIDEPPLYTCLKCGTAHHQFKIAPYEPKEIEPMPILSISEMLTKVETELFQLLEAKTSWGRTEVKAKFHEACINVCLKIIGKDTLIK